MMRCLFLILLVGVVLIPRVSVAQVRQERPDSGYLHDDRSYIDNPKYEGMVRQAFKHQPDDFRFPQLRKHYRGTSWYDPVADILREEMVNHAYVILHSADPQEVRAAKEKYKQIVSDHLGNVGVVIEALALALEDKRFGDPKFFRWMSSGLIQVVLDSGDGRTLRGAYDVNTLDEEMLLIRALNLKLIDTELTHVGALYYNMHEVKDLVSGEEFTLFVDLTLPLTKMERRKNEKGYTFDIRRQ